MTINPTEHGCTIINFGRDAAHIHFDYVGFDRKSNRQVFKLSTYYPDGEQLKDDIYILGEALQSTAGLDMVTPGEHLNEVAALSSHSVAESHGPSQCPDCGQYAVFKLREINHGKWTKERCAACHWPTNKQFAEKYKTFEDLVAAFGDGS